MADEALCNNQTNKTAMGWFLDKMLTSKMLPAESVEKMALLNRDRRSQRLRSIASELVTTLSPICLLGKPEFWQTLIKGRLVWSALEPREYQTRINAYLDERLPEIIQFDYLPLTEAELDVSFGKINHSKCDMNLALMAAAAIIAAGSEGCLYDGCVGGAF
jgi:hypothetical protein